jgi:hypothetical protein
MTDGTNQPGTASPPSSVGAVCTTTTLKAPTMALKKVAQSHDQEVQLLKEDDD